MHATIFLRSTAGIALTTACYGVPQAADSVGGRSGVLANSRAAASQDMGAAGRRAGGDGASQTEEEL